MLARIACNPLSPASVGFAVGDFDFPVITSEAVIMFQGDVSRILNCLVPGSFSAKYV